MNFIRIILIAELCLPLSLHCFQNDSFGQEGDDVKKEIQELKQMMEKMQQRITELEEKNRVLEQQAKEKEEVKENVVVEEETGVIPATAPQEPQGFLGRVAQALNPEISVIALITPAYYSLNNPVVFAENDPENTGVNMQEIEVGFQSVVDPYFRFDSFFSFRTEGVELEEAYATTLFSMPLNSQFRIGRARAKFGRINQIHRHAQNFVTLPIVNAEFLGEHLNPTSVEANFLVPVPWYMELSASGGSPDVETPTFHGGARTRTTWEPALHIPHGQLLRSERFSRSEPRRFVRHGQQCLGPRRKIESLRRRLLREIPTAREQPVPGGLGTVGVHVEAGGNA